METKHCCGCQMELSIDSFAANKTSNDGLQSMCRACFKQYRAAHHNGNGSEPKPRQRKPQLTTAETEDLAMATRNWAYQHNASVDPVTKAHGYFTVGEWCERFSKTAAEWKLVRRRMLNSRFRLSFDEGRGFYIGEKGDQAKPLGSRIKQIMTSLETSYDELLSIIDSGDWAAAKPKLEMDIAKTRLMGLRSLPKLLVAGGASVSEDFERKLLAN